MLEEGALSILDKGKGEIKFYGHSVKSLENDQFVRFMFHR